MKTALFALIVFAAVVILVALVAEDLAAWLMGLL